MQSHPLKSALPLLRCACLLTLTWVSPASAAVILFSEDFESPVIGSGQTTTTLPAGWVNHGAAFTDQLIWRPAGTSAFSSTAPLASPAGGGQVLRLAEQNSGIYRMSGSTILGNTIYEFSAAIGNSLQEPSDHYWSLQLWADVDGSGTLGGADSFITQTYGTDPAALNASPGGWATNSVQFDSAQFSALHGKQIIMLLNNFGDVFSESYYDNVTLSIMPEPSRAMLLLLGLCLLVKRRQRPNQ